MSKPHPGKTLLSPPQINICVFFKNLFSIFFSMVAFCFSIKWNLRFKFLASSLEDYRLGFWVKEQDRLNINWKGAGRQLADGITSEECVAFGEEPSHWKPVGCSSQLHLSYQHHLDAVKPQTLRFHPGPARSQVTLQPVYTLKLNKDRLQ